LEVAAKGGGGDPGWPVAPFDRMTCRQHGDAGVQLAIVYPRASEMLLGLKPPLTGRMPGMISAPPGQSSYTAQLATCWFSGAAPVWRLFPGALDWLRRLHATGMLALALQRLPVEDDGPPVPLDVDAAVAAIRNGTVIPTAVIDRCNTLTHVAAAGGRRASAANARVLQALLDAGAPLRNPRTIVRQSPSALERACYYSGPACPVENVRLLVNRLRADASNDAGHDDEVRWSAASMAANQGNAEALHIVLADLAAHAPPAEFAEALIDGSGVLYSVVTSSVFPCIAGGEKCQRCLRDLQASTHAPDVSLDKTLRAMMSGRHAEADRGAAGRAARHDARLRRAAGAHRFLRRGLAEGVEAVRRLRRRAAEADAVRALPRGRLLLRRLPARGVAGAQAAVRAGGAA
jgi:hypothetical protein